MNIPVPAGLQLRPYQIAGVEWLVNRQTGILGDDMGLGKTPQIACALNCIYWSSCLIVCPATLRINWRNELRRWLIASGWMSDAKISVIFDGKTPADGNIVIVSYDLLVKRTDLQERQWSVVAVDEAHYIKTPRAKRTKAVLALNGGRWYFATGTPMPNRPVELWPLVHKCDPDNFGNWWRYIHRYCDAHDGGHGIDTRGASNLGELQHILSTGCMLRRLKKDVLKDLPAKTRQIIELPPSKEMQAVLDRENAKWSLHEDTLAALAERRDRAAICGDDGEYRDAVKLLRAAYSVGFEDMARMRKETALAKLPLCIQHIQDVMEQSEKIIIFCHHKDVVTQLLDQLKEFNPVSITGKTNPNKRQDIVDRFQKDKRCRIFVGNIQAAGVGITLTAASVIIFVELDWTPANITQAEDRAHRIGLLHALLIQHLVLEGSLDAKMIRTIINKQEVIDHALDIQGGSAEAEKRASRSRMDYQSIGRPLDVHQRGAIIKALGILASSDSDRAQTRNGAGFSRFDSNIGHELSKMRELSDGRAGYGMTLVKKYRRQLDPSLVAKCGVPLEV